MMAKEKKVREQYITLCETLRENIKYYRKMKGMTQFELSETADVSPAYITEIEKTKVPSLEVIEKIAHALGVEPFKLLKPMDYIEDPKISKFADEVKDIFMKSVDTALKKKY